MISITQITSQLLEVLIAEIVGHAILILPDYLPVVLLGRRVMPRGGVEPHARSDLSFLQVLADRFEDVLEVLPVIVILGWLDIEVDFVAVFSVVVVEVIVGWDFVVDFAAQHQAGFVGPAPSYVLDRVASSAQQHHRSAETLHVCQQLAMTADGQVEVAEFVLGKRVGPALDDHDIRNVEGANAAHDLLEEFNIGQVVHALAQRYVRCEKLANALADLLQGASAGKEIFLELVEANSEDSVGMEEGFLDSIAVMHIDIQVEHPRVHLKQFKNAQDYIVDIAKSTGFCFLGVVVASGPVDHYIPLTSDQQVSGIDAPAGSQPAEVVESFEAGAVDSLVDLEDGVEFAIVPHLQLVLLSGSILLDYLFGLGRHPRLQVFDIVRVVKGADFLRGGLAAVKHAKLRSQVIVIDKTMDHLHAFGFHGMLLAEFILGDVFVVEVAHLTHLQQNKNGAERQDSSVAI